MQIPLKNSLVTFCHHSVGVSPSPLWFSSVSRLHFCVRVSVFVMARKPRIEFAGAVYHVRNRGNYRGDLFATAGAALAFVTCRGEACERMGWHVHADCLVRNHDHLALQKPRGNLVAGVYWLQRTLGNRFNRYRGELGRESQGALKRSWWSQACISPAWLATSISTRCGRGSLSWNSGSRFGGRAIVPSAPGLTSGQYGSLAKIDCAGGENRRKR